MISDVKEAIINKLEEIYPTGYLIYDEVLPEIAMKPSFLITVTKQSHSKRLGNKYISEVSFNIAYYSSQSAVRVDCLNVQEELLRAFDYVGNFQVRNKVAQILDNVLHLTFVIRYCEQKEDQPSIPMQQQTTNTYL